MTDSVENSSASDQFKARLQSDKLDAKGIATALKTALSEAIELKITTWVVPADANLPATDELTQPLPGYRMKTSINIVDGDIKNEIGSLFLSNGPYAEMRQFHLDQVQKGQDIVQKNLENLQLLFTVLATTLPKLAQSSSKRVEAAQQPQALLNAAPAQPTDA
jgi:hypothetical protein